MGERTAKQIRFEINVLTDFKNDVRQNLIGLDELKINVNSSWNLRGHLHTTLGALAMLHEAIDLEIRTCKSELDFEFMSDENFEDS